MLPAAKHLCPPQMLTVPLTIWQQAWQRGSQKADKRMEHGREERGRDTNCFYFLLWKIFFDTFNRRILIHLHTPKSQFPECSSSLFHVLPGKMKQPTLCLTFSFLSPLPTKTVNPRVRGLQTTGCICIHSAPQHTTALPRALAHLNYSETSPSPLFSCKCTTWNVL